MSKVELQPMPFIYPLPTVLLGAVVKGKPSYNVVGNCGIIRINPGVIYVSSLKSHYTNTGIRENNGFSANFPSTRMMEATDYCGLTSGHYVDKSSVFKSFYGKLGNVPLIEECPINIECKVIQTLDIYGMDVFIGEIAGVYADEQCIVDGKPDIKKVDPLVFSFTGGYWKLGERCGNSFSDGKKFSVKIE